MTINGIDAVVGPEFRWEHDAYASHGTCVDKGFMHNIDLRSAEDVYEDIDVLESSLKLGRRGIVNGMVMDDIGIRAWSFPRQSTDREVYTIGSFGEGFDQLQKCE